MLKRYPLILRVCFLFLLPGLLILSGCSTVAGMWADSPVEQTESKAVIAPASPTGHISALAE